MKITKYVFLTALFFTGGVAFASTEGGHGGQSLWPFIFNVINFILFLGVLGYFALPRIKAFFAERSEKIQRVLNEAEQAKASAEAKLKEYVKKIEELGKEVESIRSVVEKEGQIEKERIIASAEKEAELIKWQAKIIAEQELKQAKAALKKELAALSLERAEKIIQEKITDDDHARLVKDYITQITSKVI